MNKTQPYTTLLKEMSRQERPEFDQGQIEKETKALQLKMLRIQQGVYQRKDRVIIVFEGFDAAGKGGAIKRITKVLDPRGVQVMPIGVPSPLEQGKHWLYRFWKHLPAPGNIIIFDRSWYGRVLVEKVDGLTAAEKLKKAYEEINQFEALLQNDGITVIKIYLAITKKEQLARFERRLKDPYKQWKITMDDINARKKWAAYVKATDELLLKTNTKDCPWHVIPANSKRLARRDSLKIVTHELDSWAKWLEKTSAATLKKGELAKLLHKV